MSVGAEQEDHNQHEEKRTMDDVPSRFEPLWSIDEAAEYLKLSRDTLYGWRCRKYGPPSYRLGNKIRYRPEEVRHWVDAQEVRSWLEELGVLAS